MSERLAIHGGERARKRPWAPWPEHGEPEREALLRVLESRNWGGFPSPNTEARAFSEAFARYIGAAHAVTCSNGTQSLTLALQAARVSPGAEVITTVYTFVGTASAIVAAGAVPVFVDVLPDTYCMDPEQVAAAITPRTEAILPVHLASAMADMDRLPALAREHGLLLVEDCAHAHGAAWRGEGAGAIGDLGSFSLQSTKLLTAGEGGIVTARDPVHEQRLQSLVNCGRKEPGYDGYPEQMMGWNARMTEWQAAIGRAQLERLPGQHVRRAEGIARLERALAGVPGLAPLPRDERISQRAAYMTILRYDAEAFEGLPRDAVLLALQAEGVPCYGRFYVPLPDDPLFARDPHTNAAVRAGADYDAGQFPVASRAAYEESIWLPHELFLGSADDVDHLAAALAKVQRGAGELRSRPPEGHLPR